MNGPHRNLNSKGEKESQEKSRQEKGDQEEGEKESRQEKGREKEGQEESRQEKGEEESQKEKRQKAALGEKGGFGPLFYARYPIIFDNAVRQVRSA